MRKKVRIMACMSWLASCSLESGFDPDTSRATSLVQLELIQLASAYRAPSWVDMVKNGLPFNVSGFMTTGCYGDSTGVKTLNAAGVPRDLMLTFPASRCSQNAGGASITVSGSARIEDLGGELAFRVTYTDLRLALSVATGGSDTRINGSYELRKTSATTLLITNRTQVREVTGSSGTASDLSRTHNLTVSVDDTAGINLALRRASRAILRFEGSITHVSQSTARDSLSIQVTTPVPMRTDVNCLQGFSAGELRGVATGTSQTQLALRYSCS